MLNRAGEFLHLLGAANSHAERFDVNVDARTGVGSLQDFVFQFRSGGVGFRNARSLFHFQMPLDEEMSVVLVRRYFVNGEAATLGDGANGFEGMLVLAGARLDVNHHVRGDDLADAFLHRFAGGVGLLETGCARNADGDVHEITLAGTADTHAFGAQHAFGFIHGSGDSLAQAAGSHVEQRVGGAFAKPRADPDDHAGDAECRYRVQFAEPGDAKFQSEPCSGNTENDDERAPHVRGEMQGVGFQGFAGIFFRDTVQRAGANEINPHGKREDEDGSKAGTHFYGVKHEALNRLPDNVNGGEQQKGGFDEGGKTFHFAVAVQVVGVG